MEIKKHLTKEKINNLTIILALVTFVSALLGYLSSGLGFVQSVYSVFSFFGGNGDSADIANSLLLSIAAITAPLSVTTLILLIFYRKISAWFFLRFMAKGHIVIAGLGNMGSTLARDILADKKIYYSKLIILESDGYTPYEARIKILEGDFRAAAEMFDKYLNIYMNEQDRTTMEFIAKEYFDYLLSLKEAQQVEKFLLEKENALKLPDDPLNLIYKNKIKKIEI